MTEPTAIPRPRRRAEPTPFYVTLSEAGELLGVSERTIRRMIARGELRSRHISPGAHRVERASIDDFVGLGRVVG